MLGLESGSGKAAEMGTCFHKIAECLGKGKLHYQNTGEIKCDIGDEFIGEFIVDDIFSNEHLARLAKHCWTYYSSISENDWDEKDILKLIKWTNDALSFQGGSFDPRKRTIFAIEHYFDIEIKKDWAFYKYEIEGKEVSGYLRIKGTIDLIEEIDSSTLEVCDYKTGKKPYNWITGKDKTLADFQKDPQLLIYYYALKNLYPDKEMMFTVYYLVTGQPFTVVFDKRDYEKAEQIIKKKFEHIKENEKPKLLSPTQKQRDKNFKCYLLCHFHKNNYPGTETSICEFFQNKIKETSLAKVTEEYAKLDKLVNYGDGGGRKAEIKE